MDIIPFHRRPPPAELLTDANRYVRVIQEMREQTKHAKDFNNNPQGPISHAIENVKEFSVSASEWGTEHLTRFQIIILRDQVSAYLFPYEYLLEYDDPTMMALATDGFFLPDASAIGNGTWDRSKLHHFFYLTMMLLCRGGNRKPTPRNSLNNREILPRAAKDDAREEILRILDTVPEVNIPHSPTRSRSSSDYSSVSTTSTTHSYGELVKGPRETLTFMLLHQFLSYLGTIEVNSKNPHPLWIACPDSSQFPVIAAGQQFGCENDGSVFVWKRKHSGMRKSNHLPICSLKCKREHHFKTDDGIFAQEAAELISLAMQNYVADEPSVRPNDEAYVVCCHNTTIHITAAVVSPDYIQGITHDTLGERDFLVVKRGQEYDLMNQSQRRQACREVLSLLRYLSSDGTA